VVPQSAQCRNLRGGRVPTHSASSTLCRKGGVGVPRIKRWFPVSHDINSDIEVWELTDKFGLTGLRAWLEILSIADRNDGLLPGKFELYPRVLAGRCKSTTRHLVGVCQFITRWLIVDCQGIARVANYTKYHRPREHNPVPSEPDQTEPYLKKDTHTSVSEPKSDLSVQDLVDSWNENFKGTLPSVEWPLSTSRHRKASARLKEHRSLDFWQQVFTNISTSDFLRGKGNGTWRCTLDFVVANDTNCIKIYEGAYNGKQGQNNQRRYN